MKKHIASLIGAGLTLAVLGAKVLAAPGDQVAPPGPILPVNGCGAFNGVGVAYDGTNVLFTCTDEAAIRKTDTSGANLGSLATSDAGGNPVALDAIAWDSANSLIWGGDVDAGNALCRIWSVDPNTGTATFRFSFADPTGSGRCSVLFFDGITVDANDGTLWLSPDVHTEIYHYQTNGTLIAGDTIDFETLTAGKCPWAQGLGAAGCYNSGLAMGLDGNLFAGTAQDGKIMQLDPVTPAFLSEFSTVTGRDEDLECGPLVNGFETILSRDYETGRIDLLEAPDGTCVITQITLDPATALNDLTTDDDHTVTATVTANGQPLPGVTVNFSVNSGPSSPQVSDPGECSVNPNCDTDASGQTSWTYSNPDGVGVDVIEACYTTVGGTQHCAKAEKEWRDLTAPRAACTETTNPNGQKTPPAGSTTLPGSHGGQNEDGFYELLGKDVVDPNVQIFVLDTGSGTVFGPFTPGTKIKYTEANGATPSQKKIGSDNGQAGAVDWHITGTGDMAMYAVDGAGNQSANVSCLVPPPPK